MKEYLNFLNELAENVESRHSKYNKPVNWFNPYKSFDLEKKKNEIHILLADRLNMSFKNTKPWINSISKGCQICGEGDWSCLFITGKCNGTCFYCPSKQDEDETPQTQKLLFEKPENYIDYINTFKFRGVSFSGGEPLLFFDRTVDFISKVRAGCNPDLYIWMYTNGILADEEKFRILGSAGLNEIRFDLGAVNYNPKVLRNASKYIQNATIEIPAVPEDKEKLFEVLPVLCEYGVTNLNLHQLRLTEYNSSKLLERGYTFLHGEQPVAIESEITAFEVMKFVRDNNLPIGVNYCNFQFKNRFQKAGFRKRMASRLMKEDEELTENGYLRKIEALENDKQRVMSISELNEKRREIVSIKIYYTGRVIENINKKGTREAYRINENEYPLLEGLVASPVVLSGILIDDYLKLIEGSGKTIPNHPLLFEVWKYEFIEEGMREYF